MEVKNKKLFKELIKKLALEIMNETDDEIDEITSTANAPGYSTPKAFVGKNKKKKNKKLKQSLKQVGYSIAEDIESSLKLIIREKKEEQYKPGDVWKRDGGSWAAKNSKGSIQGYKNKEDAESWAKDEVPKSKELKDKNKKKKVKKDDDSGDTKSTSDNDNDDGDDTDAIEKEEEEELKKKATQGFFKSKWDDFGKKGALSVAKSALDKGEKAADELEKGDAPIKGKDVLDKGKDIEQFKKSQDAAAKALRKKQAAKDKKAKAEKAKADKEAEKKKEDAKKKAKKTKKKPVKKRGVKRTKKKLKVKEDLDNKDIKQVKKLIRQVVADILRDLWIKRSVWKDK